jgi:hypothetical protein
MYTPIFEVSCLLEVTEFKEELELYKAADISETQVTVV